jgi:hypothetical protein
MKKNPYSLITLMVAASALCVFAQQDASGPRSATQEQTRQHKGPGGGEGMQASMIERFDADGDGTLSDTEKASMEAARTEMTTKFDADGDGTLSETERSAMREAQMTERFDTDGDGVLSDEEKASMPARGEGKRGKGEGRPG